MSPNARHLLVAAKSTGVDSLVDSVLVGSGEAFDNFKKAEKVYQSPLRRSYVEACLIAEKDLQKISTLLEVPLEVLTAYKNFFFDITGMSRIELLELIDLVPEEEQNDRSMKMWALSQGLDFIAWRLGKSVVINPVEGLKELFTICSYKSKEALFSANSSTSSIEATKWAKLSMDLARLLKAWVMDGDAAKKEIEMALQSLSPTFASYENLDKFNKEGGEDPMAPALGTVLSGDDVSEKSMPFASVNLISSSFEARGYEDLDDLNDLP